MGDEKVIASFNRVLSKTERNYYVTYRELLAIVSKLLNLFAIYLLRQKFLFRTDHVSLKWLISLKDLEG